MKKCICLALVVAGITPCLVSAQDKQHDAIPSEFGTYVEPDFPFFSQTVDARDLGGEWPKDNLTPRGIVIDAGHGVRVCFDTDLLRVALVWRENADGEFLQMNGMAPGSYRVPSQKAGSGQGKLPKPIGEPLLANGIYPGWFVGEGEVTLADPRAKSVDVEEIGLGPVASGSFGKVSFSGDRVEVSYLVGETNVTESYMAPVGGGWVRKVTVEAHAEPLTLVMGAVAGDLAMSASGSKGVALTENDGVWQVSIPPMKDAQSLMFSVDVDSDALAGVLSQEGGDVKTQPRWPEVLKPAAILAESDSGLVRDDIGMPMPNPWKRNVRPSGFDFFSDGRAALCTFDGDVWIVSGLEGDLNQVKWQRFSSGLHEPMGLEIVDDEIFVFDRNGIWIVREGEHEMFCNLVAQTAETREFAMDIYAKPGGGFYIAKGGQIGTTRGKYNGTIIDVAADGKSFEVIATGLRQPYIGVDPKTGLVTSSDQQGNWKPATPIHVVRKGEYYGFQAETLKDKPEHPQPIDEPAVWIPHFVNQSGASQVWLRDAEMGPLNDSLIHIGYNRPELFKVYIDRDAADEAKGIIQGAVTPVMAGFGTGPLHGRVHPVDGSLYLVGFKIWGTVGEDISGMYRMRWKGGPNYVPREVRSDERGILLSFDEELDEAIATSLSTYTVDRWNYVRSHNYGSGNYKLDGQPGQETLPVSSAYLSKDKKSVFLGVPDMQPVHSMRLTYRVAAATETPLIQNAYLTVHELRSVDLAEFGFPGELDVDLTVKAGAATDVAMVEPSVEEGKKTAELFGCVACHTTDGTRAVAADPTTVVGPTWKGLFGSRRDFSDGTFVKEADKVYLRESIVDPGRKVAKGFEMEKTGVGMPSYLGVLKDYQIDSIVLYIESLGVKAKK